ncbi:MAG: hypothetical protein ACFCGT_28530 [Sandaracinaceae bacterium]
MARRPPTPADLTAAFLALLAGSAGCYRAFDAAPPPVDQGRPVDAGLRTRPPVPSEVRPPGPANLNRVAVLGTAVAGATIVLRAGPRCEGPPLGAGDADGDGTFAVEVEVPDDTATVIHGTARLAPLPESSCSVEGVLYVEDSTPPPPPELLGTEPVSPSEDRGPRVFGRAEPGSLVRMFLDAACTVRLSATQADDAGSFSLFVGVPEGPSGLYATATDRAGNTSGCAGPLPYVAR